MEREAHVCRYIHKRVAAAVKAVHPYEEPVINVIPLYRTGL